MLNLADIYPSLAYPLSAGLYNPLFSGETRNLDQLASTAAEVRSLLPVRRRARWRLALNQLLNRPARLVSVKSGQNHSVSVDGRRSNSSFMLTPSAN
jgi:hypothetical protein